MPDRTLTNGDLKERAAMLLAPFESKCVQGASYDIRVGAAILFAPVRPDEGPQAKALGGPVPDCTIPPGAACIIQSLERLSLPRNMKGRLSLRAQQAKRLLFFAGGQIDPGYEDYLHLPVVNLSDVPLKVTYGERLVSAEFTELEKAAMPYTGLSPVVLEGPPTILDRVRLSERVEEHGVSLGEMRERLETRLTELEEKQRASDISVQASRTILELVVLAVVAGAAIGVGGSLVNEDLSVDVRLLVLGAALVLGTAAMVLVVVVMVRRRS